MLREIDMQLVVDTTQQPHRINIVKYRKSKSFMIAHMQFCFHLCAIRCHTLRIRNVATIESNIEHREASFELCAFAWVIIYEE